jgi:preprotein translocase subunit YajC
MGAWSGWLEPDFAGAGLGPGVQVAGFGNGVFSVIVAMWLLQAGGGVLSRFGSLPLLLVFFAAMYFLMIAPQQRKQKKWQEMLSQLKSGDKVTTSGGIRGTVLSVKDDAVVLRVQPDGVKLEFVRSAIAAVTTADESAS